MKNTNDCTDPAPLEYKCRFCTTTGVAYYERSCPPIHLDVWAKMIACDRCADYHTKLNRLTESITGRCRSLHGLMTNSSAQVREDAMRSTAERLTASTQALARHVCAFWRCAYTWDKEFVALLTERPDCAGGLVADYARRIKVNAQNITPGLSLVD